MDLKRVSIAHDTRLVDAFGMLGFSWTAQEPSALADIEVQLKKRGADLSKFKG